MLRSLSLILRSENKMKDINPESGDAWTSTIATRFAVIMRSGSDLCRQHGMCQHLVEEAVRRATSVSHPDAGGCPVESGIGITPRCGKASCGKRHLWQGYRVVQRDPRPRGRESQAAKRCSPQIYPSNNNQAFFSSLMTAPVFPWKRLSMAISLHICCKAKENDG